jgi:hypothetical protein
MGLGEVGGDDSVQVSVYFQSPRTGETEAGDGPSVWARAKGKNQLSEKGVKINPAAGEHAYRGQDTQHDKDRDHLENFTVTVNFNNRAEVEAAQAAFAAVLAAAGPGGGAGGGGGGAAGTWRVIFLLAVKHKTPGQIQIEWVD